MLIGNYDEEKETLQRTIRELEKRIDSSNAAMSDVERFSKLIQKYISFEELDSFMLHELIEKIISLLGIGRFDGSLREFTDRDLQVDIIHLSLNLIDKKKYFPYN